MFWGHPKHHSTNDSTITKQPRGGLNLNHNGRWTRKLLVLALGITYPHLSPSYSSPDRPARPDSMAKRLRAEDTISRHPTHTLTVFPRVLSNYWRVNICILNLSFLVHPKSPSSTPGSAWLQLPRLAANTPFGRHLYCWGHLRSDYAPHSPATQRCTCVHSHSVLNSAAFGASSCMLLRRPTLNGLNTTGQRHESWSWST